uniref:Anthocyanidin 3-O-glucosyltransferase n=1 Tax=Aegilops tauschii TaxID=37682 RepID=M8BIU5_AEGTA
MLAAVPHPPLEHPEANPAVASVFEQAAAARRAVPSYERNAMTQFVTGHGTSSGMSGLQRCLLTEKRCTLMAIRSCVEWEPESFPLLATLLGKPILKQYWTARIAGPGCRCSKNPRPLGLGVGGDEVGPAAERADGEGVDVGAGPGARQRVALVDEGVGPGRGEEQVRELALGLELAGTRFLWALRKPIGADDNPLPPGFEERTHDRGLVATGWVPQMSILAHAAFCGFLTHCGLNSLIEGLLFGHPLVMLPILGDQGPNARQMEAKKVGLQVARDKDDGSFDRHGVASAVGAVMVEGEERRGFVANALKMQAVVAEKELQDRYIDEFVQHLRSYGAASADPILPHPSPFPNGALHE